MRGKKAKRLRKEAALSSNGWVWIDEVPNNYWKSMNPEQKDAISKEELQQLMEQSGTD